MEITFESRYAIGPNESKNLDTKGLRANFLIEKLFGEDTLHFTYSHYDRYIVAGVMPVHERLKLETIEPLLKEDYFLKRREMVIINVAGDGIVEVDGELIPLNFKEALYIGKGVKDVYFQSNDNANPANFI
jgi:4-deoxy-L-threo-5-hexosulose-uronate ketol-isomerase